jgi:AcrR family transcriptional regulator
VPRQERSRRSVAALLDAAERVFGRDGFTAGTLTAVAEEAGVGIATLYAWFPTKDDLVVGIAERHLQEGAVTMAAVAAELRQGSPRLAELARSMVEAVVEANSGDHAVHARLFESFPRTPEVLAQVQVLLDAMTDEVVWHLGRLGLANRPTMLTRLRADVVVHAVFEGAHTLAVDPPEWTTRQAVIDELVRLVVRSLDA